MIRMAKNEFEELDDDIAPKAEVSEVAKKPNSMIASGQAGETYDWTQAPDGLKAPPRIDLSGKIVTLRKADIILPPMSRPWEKTKKGDKLYKYCTFTLFYSEGGQQENYSGVRVFKREENGEDRYSPPTIMRDRANQASNLLGLYADFRGKDINEISLREFLGYLNSGCKVKIMKVSTKNPETGVMVDKNMVQEFVA